MIYWVFGGTAVGKKTFIRALEEEKVLGYPRCLPVWIEDGELDPMFIVDTARHCDIAVRWQWGREKTLVQIAAQYPSLQHMIFVVQTTMETQITRVVKREGTFKWGIEVLLGESREIYGMVRGISLALGIEARIVNSADEFTVEEPIV